MAPGLVHRPDRPVPADGHLAAGAADGAGAGELVGIETGDDLGRLIPGELASLGVPAMRAVFAARYAEQRLFVYEQRGEAEAGQGAIICCVDWSGSMGARLQNCLVSPVSAWKMSLRWISPPGSR